MRADSILAPDIVVQLNPIATDEGMGLQLGALTIVTDAGAAWLHQVPFEPLIARALG